MGSRTLHPETTAEAYLELLPDRGIDVFLGNAGTDFASLVEAFARCRGRGRARAAPAGHPARVRRRVDGARLLRGGRAPGRGDGPRQRRHRQRLHRHHHRRPRQRAHPHVRRAHAGHRGRAAGLARPAHPLGAGELRPGRDAARVREVGLRAAHARPARGRRRPRARADAGRAARAGLSDAAARGAGRQPRRDDDHLAGRAGRSRSERFPDPARIDEAARILARAEYPLVLVSGGGHRSARGRGPRRARRGGRDRRGRGGSDLPELPAPPRPAPRLQRRPAPPTPRWPRPTRSWSSRPTCPGTGARRSRRPARRSSTSASIRSSRAIRCAAIRATCRSRPRRRSPLPLLVEAVRRHADPADVAARARARGRRAPRAPRGLGGGGAGAGERLDDRLRVGGALHRRDRRRRARWS